MQSTQIYERKPFLLGGMLLTIIGLIPPLLPLSWPRCR
ncbi:hypothetical protein RCO48_20885 [Peribacillus frigoritolerans]|nr:hypothetical protein [Peribacillus frigoritolerans]